ncbi:L-fucose kinase [Cavenderia fasciculata]|uniref:L-fucose kinase n=1 Tax=Cavenderia fasciculata TaxID=261658 RepID=F4PU15_CACFS|nr:L-fucose kinase [Cavenderia fasciculata]EGG21783.1 L-fucose kinase [Cavenderia fasciculata]|eukprot:XP_004359633.1 L-fucose kinase [Cavenderia fasciculata]
MIQITITIAAITNKTKKETIYKWGESSKALMGSSLMKRRGWDAIGVTASTYEQAHEFVNELNARKCTGMINENCIIVPIPDPVTSNTDNIPIDQIKYLNFTRIGSGTSTLNSLVTIADKLSGLAGRSFIDIEVVKNSKILLLHIGGLFHHMTLVNLCSKAFTCMVVDKYPLRRIHSGIGGTQCPTVDSGGGGSSSSSLYGLNNNEIKAKQETCRLEMSTASAATAARAADDDYADDPAWDVADVYPLYPIDILLSNLNRIERYIDAGMIVASTESLVLLENDVMDIQVGGRMWNSEGIQTLVIPVDAEVATRHIAVKTDAFGVIQEFGNKFSETELRDKEFIFRETNTKTQQQEEKVMVYTNIIRMCPKSVEKLLYLQSTTPFNSCTTLALDNGASLLKFSVYPEILEVMSQSQKLVSYLSLTPHHYNPSFVLEMARQVLWKTFRSTPLTAISVKGHYSFLKDAGDLLSFLKYQKEIVEDILIKKVVHSYIDNKNPIDGCVLSGSWSVGKDCVILGVRESFCGAHFADRMTISEVQLKSPWNSKPKHCKSINQIGGIGGLQNKKSTTTTTTTPHTSDIGGIDKLIESSFDNNTTNNITSDHGSKTIMGISSSENRPRVLVIVGIDDNIDLLYTDPKATIANQKWDDFFTSSGISPDELWPPNYPRLLRSARLFPVLSVSGDEDMLESALWIQDLTKKPPLSVIGRWKASKRMSIADITGETTLIAETRVKYLQRTATLSASVQQLPRDQVCQLQEQLEHSNRVEGDVAASFLWRRVLSFRIDMMRVNSVYSENWSRQCLDIYFLKWSRMRDHTLDSALQAMDRILITTPSHVVPRILSNMSDLMAIWMAGRGGIRTGPAHHSKWCEALLSFSRGDEKAGILKLTSERANWLDTCENVIIAARHYDAACQILIKNVVDRSPSTTKPLDSGPVPIEKWVRVETPGRLDLGGFWTDFAPMSYEQGGRAVTAAIHIDGVAPYVCRARRISEPIVIFSSAQSGSPLVLQRFADFTDFKRPLAPYALLKACFLQVGIVNPPWSVYNSHAATITDPTTTTTTTTTSTPPSTGDIDQDADILKNLRDLQGRQSKQTQHHKRHHESLKQQLEIVGGLEVEISCPLPYGSGLGSSSLLAASVLTAIARIYGVEFMSPSHLVHACTKVEHMMTTCGGFSDSLGGVVGGLTHGWNEKIDIANLTKSKQECINVQYYNIQLTPDQMGHIGRHMLLVNTNRPRLNPQVTEAIRGFLARKKSTLDAIESIASQTDDMRKAIQSADLAEIGRLLTKYWHTKKQVSTGSKLPGFVMDLEKIIHDQIHGYSAVGAGGGFLLLITKEHNDVARQNILQLLAAHELDHQYDSNTYSNITLHIPSITNNGITLNYEDHSGDPQIIKKYPRNNNNNNINNNNIINNNNNRSLTTLFVMSTTTEQQQHSNNNIHTSNTTANNTTTKMNAAAADNALTHQAPADKLSWFQKIQKKFTVPPPPKTLKDALKRDYILVGGAFATLGFLSSGVYNHMRGGNQITTNKLLRGRIYAQAATVGIMCIYAFTYQAGLDKDAAEEARKNQKIILT